MARKSQHSVTKRLRESKKAEKTEQKRARRAERKEGGLKPPEESTDAPDPEGESPPQEPSGESE